MTRTLAALSSMMLLVTACVCAGDAVTDDQTAPDAFYVSPVGQDDWSGTRWEPTDDGSDGPFATLHRACRAVRERSAAAPSSIVIQPGDYFLDHPVVLTGKDSGLTIGASSAMCASPDVAPDRGRWTQSRPPRPGGPSGEALPPGAVVVYHA